MKTLQLSFYLFVLLLSGVTAEAQKENNIWNFGHNLGIDFNSGSPALISSNIDAYEGCASVCDASGALLFYTNGVRVYDKTLKVMPNGGDLLGNTSTTQGAVISPVRGEPGKYFLFSLEAFESAGGMGKLYYSLIDMSLNGGKGDVVRGFKNIELGKGMSEKMTLAASCDAIWLITHDAKKPIFYAWPLSASSVVPVPVISVTDGPADVVIGGVYMGGEIKMSTDYRNLYMANSGNGYIARFDFDLKTGSVKGYELIDSVSGAYSLELSAANTKLYVAEMGINLYQYDLSGLPDMAKVRASKTAVGSGITCLRRGPDKKIYMNTYSLLNQIFRISDPELSGMACGVEDVPDLLSTNRVYYLQFGSNTVPFSGLALTDMVYSRMDTILCAGKTALFSKDNTYEGMTWNDGSTAPERVLSKAGTYWRRYGRDCTIYVDTIVVGKLRQPDTIARRVLDTMVCFLPELEVKTNIPSDQYTWSDGGSGTTSVFRNPGIRWVAALNKDKNCSLDIDTFSVSFTDFNLDLRDTFLCQDQEIDLDAATSGVTAYHWSDGSSRSSIHVDKTGKYWVSASMNGCSKTDTINVRSHALGLSLGPDREVCNLSKVQLDPAVTGADTYTWQDGSTGPAFTAADSGQYFVTVSRGGCTEQAGVHIAYMPCIECIHLPNMFTPNGDGTNDVFRALTRCPVLKFELIIVDRYGQTVFSAKQATASWDGTLNGQELVPGVYYYLVRATFDRGQDLHEELFKGDISLLR